MIFRFFYYLQIDYICDYSCTWKNLCIYETCYVEAAWCHLLLSVHTDTVTCSGHEFLCNSRAWKGKTSIFCVAWGKRWSLSIQSKGTKNCFRGEDNKFHAYLIKFSIYALSGFVNVCQMIMSCSLLSMLGCKLWIFLHISIFSLLIFWHMEVKILVFYQKHQIVFFFCSFPSQVFFYSYNHCFQKSESDFWHIPKMKEKGDVWIIRLNTF